jgi:hypothetical protein
VERESVILSKQVVFVITVDIEDREAFIDDALFMAKFGKSEQAWDTDAQEWVEDPDNELYYQALEILNTVPLNKD